jgi:hypothetical protein
MLIKSTLLLSVAVLIGLSISPSYGGDIISCDSFENCPDGSVPSTNALLALEARMDALEGATADLCALYQELRNQSLLGALQVPSYCPATQKVMFVTSVTYNGNLGGLTGADDKCMDRAGQGNLTGTFKAWLSAAGVAPADRNTQSTVPYVLTTGTQIAENWTDLTDLSLAVAINTDESGNAVDPNSESWNGGTYYDGTVRTVNTGQQCDGWVTDVSGKIGMTGKRNVFWVTNNFDNGACNEFYSLVCIEQ